MLRVKLFTVLAILVVFSVVGFSPAHATYYWKQVGANPNQLPAYESLKALGVPHEIIVLGVLGEEGHSVMVGFGEKFNSMNFGKGQIREDVVVGFEQWEIADKWTESLYGLKWEIFRFRKCGNWAIRTSPNIISSDSLVPSAPIKVTHHGDVSCHLPWWLWLWLILLTLAVIWALFRRGPQGDPGKDGKNAVIEILGATGSTAIPPEGARVIVIPLGSSADPEKSNPGVAEAGSTKPVSDMSSDELVAELRGLKNEYFVLRHEIDGTVIPVILEARIKVADLKAKKAVMKKYIKELAALAYPPKPAEATAEASAPSKKERSEGPSF